MSPNPPAFPVSPDVQTQHTDFHGMTLRDWFAGQALAGLLASEVADSAPSFAEEAFRFADAMLVARVAAEPPAPAMSYSEDEIARMKRMLICNIVNGTCTTCDQVEAECTCLPF